MFQLQFKNQVNLVIDVDEKGYNVRAYHPKAGYVKPKGFENRCYEDSFVKNLTSEELVRFMDQASRLRFTEEGEQCIAFFNF